MKSQFLKKTNQTKPQYPALLSILRKYGRKKMFLTLKVRSSDATLVEYGYLYSYTEFDLIYIQSIFLDQTT